MRPGGVISKKPPRLYFPSPRPTLPNALLSPRFEGLLASSGFHVTAPILSYPILSYPILSPGQVRHGHGSTIHPSFHPRPSVILKMAR